MAHTRFNTRQKHCAAPVPAPSLQSLGPAPNALLGERAAVPRRAASVSRGSLCGRLLDRGWRETPSLGLLPLRWGRSSPGRDPALGHHGPPSSGRLTTAAVSELAVLSNLQFGGVGGGDAVTGLHAVPLFQLCQGAHEAGVGSIQ